jgi:HlyD family secretion protein
MTARAIALVAGTFVIILLALPALPAEPQGTAVTAVQAKSACFPDTLSVTGVLVPRSEVLVRPDQEGLQIAQVSADVGDSVKAGQVLAQLVRPTSPQGAANQVLAPVAGTILRRAAVVGTTASAYAEPLFSIIAQGEVEVSAEAPTKSLSRLSPGQVAKIKVVGVGELPGSVRFVSSSVDPTSQQGEARVSVGANPALRVGAFARAVVTLGQGCGVAVPLSAVLYGAEGPVVQVVRGQRIQTRAVAVGLISDGKIQVTKGLADGDVVVVRAGAFLRDGDQVRPVLTDDANAGK